MLDDALVDLSLTLAPHLDSLPEPVLHLDLKSANVLLDEHGVAKVADFGLSHIKKETAVITARMGSPQWTAPEILRGQVCTG